MKRYSRRVSLRAAFRKMKQAQGLRPNLPIPPPLELRPTPTPETFELLSQNESPLAPPTSTSVPTLLPPTATSTPIPTLPPPTLLPPTQTPTPMPTPTPRTPPPLAINPQLPISALELPTYVGKPDHSIVLSFDDGPDLEKPPRLLNLLAAYEIRAVFFVLGRLLELEPYRQIVQQAHSQGHIIANHTYSHPDLTTIDDAYVRWELNRTQELIGEFGHPQLPMRPPYGAMDNRVFNIMFGEGYTGVLWNVDSRDWLHGDSADWVEGTIEEIKEHQDCMVLFHDTRDNTINYLEYFIQRVNAIPRTRFVPFLSNEFNNDVWGLGI